MAEFSDSPLWGKAWDFDIVGMLMPSDLGINEPLASDLIAWNDQYSSTVSTTTYQWPTPKQAAQHEANGLKLVARLQAFLGDGYVVLYTGDVDPPIRNRPESDDGTTYGLALVGRKPTRRFLRRRRV
jgi:hypothetical protein